jgi:hypothetical protein
MLTCTPTRSLASTGAHPANATPWLDLAPHNLDDCRSLAMHTASAPPNGPAQVTAIPSRAQSAALAHRKQHPIPILLPR